MRRSILWLVALSALLVIMAAAGYQPARAAGVVGTGTPGSCTEAAFGAALGGGGLVTFNCGAAPVSILLTYAGGSIPAGNTTVDGGGKITLDGGNSVRIFHLIAGSELTLTNITLRNGNAGAGNGGCILNDAGGLLVLRSAFVTKCMAVHGGAIFNSGTATLNSSTISGNTAGFNGGGIVNHGTLVVNNSTFSGNTAGYAGGGINNLSTATLTNLTLSANTVGFYGGGINNVGTVLLNISTLSGNTSGYDGGGIYNAGTATINDSTLSGNRADYSAGGILNNGTTTLNNSTLSANTSGDYGGGILNYGTTTINNSTLSANTAGVYGGGINNVGTVLLNNSTLSGNTASSSGGGVHAYGGSKTLARNLTVSNNAAPLGGGLTISPTAQVALTNTIIAYSPAGGNCGGASVSAFKYSMSSDGTCGAAVGGTLTIADPKLTALGNYGGLTWVHMLKAGSPAINGVSGSDAPSTDQRGFARPIGGFYDIGAVERQAGDSDLAPRLFLPFVRR